MKYRLVHLKNYLNFFEFTSLKRIVDFAIFLTVFALISSAISIFYEIKINDISLKISQEQTKLRIYNSHLELISTNLHENKRRLFNAVETLYVEQDLFDESQKRREGIFRIFQVLNQMPKQLIYAAHDMRYNFTEDQIEKFDIKSLEDGFENIVETIKDNTYLNTKKSFEELQTNILTAIFKTEKLQKKTISIFTEAKLEIEENITLLSENKYKISNLSTNIILISFVLQLLIFIAIQFVDIKSSEEV